MDLGFYLSSLLNQHGEISVPGLGFLAQARLPAYYDYDDGKFYPPFHQVLYDPQEIDDDDTLTQYIADDKNISFSSAKYFIEKYITGLKQDTLVKEVPIENLGWFYTEGTKLSFRPDVQENHDPAFFGYTPVPIPRIGNAPIAESFVKKVSKPAPVSFAPVVPAPIISVPEPVAPVPAVIAAPEPVAVAEPAAVYTPPQPPVAPPRAPEPEPMDMFNQYIANLPGEEEIRAEEQAELAAHEAPPQKARPNLLIVLAMAVLIVIAGIFIVYKFYPSLYIKLWGHLQTQRETKMEEQSKPKTVPVKAIVPVVPDSIKKDSAKTIKTDPVKVVTRINDEKLNETPAVNPMDHWEIIALESKNLDEIQTEIDNLNKNHVNYWKSANTVGSKIRIAVATAITNDEADATRKRLIAAKKIPTTSYIEEIKPQ